MSFIAREHEQRKLDKLFRAPSQNAALVYGRRRVGKSELLLHCLRQAGAISVYYESRQTTEVSNIKNISEVICDAFGLPRLAFADIEEALRFVFDRAQNEKVILVIDEYPYLRDVVTGMDSILQALLDRYRDRSQLSLVLCGSYVNVMKSLLDQDNPLYGRIDLKLNLQPMDYYDSAKFYPNFSCEDKIRLYGPKNFKIYEKISFIIK